MARIEQLQQLALMCDVLGLHCELLSSGAGQALGAVDEPTLAALYRHQRRVGDARLGGTNSERRALQVLV